MLLQVARDDESDCPSLVSVRFSLPSPPLSLSLSRSLGNSRSAHCSVRDGTLARVKDFSRKTEQRMENISLGLMDHQSCKTPDDEENIPQGIVMFDYSPWKRDIFR